MNSRNRVVLGRGVEEEPPPDDVVEQPSPFDGPEGSKP
jgi:hypothetical protein